LVENTVISIALSNNTTAKEKQDLRTFHRELKDFEATAKEKQDLRTFHRELKDFETTAKEK